MTGPAFSPAELRAAQVRQTRLQNLELARTVRSQEAQQRREEKQLAIECRAAQRNMESEQALVGLELRRPEAPLLLLHGGAETALALRARQRNAVPVARRGRFRLAESAVR